MTMTDTTPIERGTYALFALATPNHGDQLVEVFNVPVLTSSHPDALPPGWYWQRCYNVSDDGEGAFDEPSYGPSPIEVHGPLPSEQAALDAARAHYGY
jgi:hypothetical protein